MESARSINVESNHIQSLKNLSDNPEANPKKSSLNHLQQNLFWRASENSEKQVSNDQPAQFLNEKKSYRKKHSKHIACVPYRKCHSLMEEKVINVINKIKSGKECQK